MNSVSSRRSSHDGRPPKNWLDLTDRILTRASRSWSCTSQLLLLLVVTFGCLRVLGYLLIEGFRTIPNLAPILGATGGVGSIAVLLGHGRRPKV
jgi:hypothetical protein